MADSRRGVVLSVDLGSVRIGIAASDPHRILAFPVTTLSRNGGELDEIVALIAEREAVEVIVGLPTDLRGRDGIAAAATREWTDELITRISPVPVQLVDERMTTAVATRRIREAGGPKGSARKTIIDQEAAVALLQGHLDGQGVA